ncbi:hypothetical protein [Hymenobacter terrenus]|uniref:hypothetical protein n=1 Tax=Hymenobacter terrenus TaxID=1629124 RepID=UPI000619CD05|nr:hypothetical protein [Hymenobacter terrenus]
MFTTQEIIRAIIVGTVVRILFYLIKISWQKLRRISWRNQQKAIDERITQWMDRTLTFRQLFIVAPQYLLAILMVCSLYSVSFCTFFVDFAHHQSFFHAALPAGGLVLSGHVMYHYMIKSI